ncbi:WAS/WASL-interacting protein family member 3-like, partial [Engraulis encrasicolus]|uniref:WAS/WASL-interacting protein family member 3-like n=1 Tax=Engraulis encrasicolus TaxID=184585 RepID=UPI002FD4F392
GSRWHDVDTHDSWEDRVAVPVSEAVVTFTDVQNKQHVIFENGMMTEDALRIFKGRLFINTHLDVLQFEMSGADSKAVGRYVVTEKKGRAFVIDVAGGSGGPTIPDRAVPIALAASILTLFIIGCCVRRCSNKKKEAPSPAVASAATPSAPAATPSAPSDPPVYIHGPVPRPEPAYQPGAQSRVEDIRDSPTTHSYDSPPPSYDELMANGPAPYVPYVPYAPPEGPTGAYGVPVIPTPAEPSAPSPPDYQYQPGGLSGTTSDFLSG